MRLDVWLWSVRVFRSRGLAVEAIRGGRVQVGGLPAKPAREVRPGETVTADTGVLRRVLQVVGCPPSRVGAARVAEFATDLTPPEERERARTGACDVAGQRPRGSGRPTKRDRRALDSFLG
ncbi:MAG: RNA-binding S4 domain-containing protein [Verrucomicrobiota bacterium]